MHPLSTCLTSAIIGDTPKILKKHIAVGLMAFLLGFSLLWGCGFGRDAKSVKGLSPDQGWTQAEKEAIFHPARRWPQEASDLQPDPSVVYGGLPSGFRYVLMQNKRPENRVSMHLFVQTGSMHERDVEQGVAHFLEHLMFNGSAHFKPGELVKYFQDIGMRFGPDANAHTGFYSTVYDIDLPKGDTDGLAAGLRVFRDYADGALLLETEVEKERAVILSEKRTQDSVDYRTFEASFAFELPEALLSRRLPIGKEETIQNATRPLIKAFYDDWYRPDNMVLVMAGDFDTAKAAALIHEAFGDMSPRGAKREYPDPGKVRHQGLKPFYHFEPEAGNVSITIETIVPKAPEDDGKEERRKRLHGGMANTIMNHRLSKMLEDPATPFTGASFDSGRYLNYLEGADFSAECKPENWETTLAVMEQTLRKALLYGFTEAEVERVKKNHLTQLDQAVKTAPTRESRQLAQQIMHQMAGNQVFQSPAQKKALLSPMIKEATREDLHNALKSYWLPDHRLVLLTGNADLRNPDTTPEERIRRIWDQSSRKSVQKPEEKAAVVFPYLPAPTHKGVIVGRDLVSDLGVVGITFANGVRLNLKKTDFKANQILAALVFGEGRRGEPKDKPGLSVLTERVVNLSGLGRLTRDEISQALAGKTTQIQFKTAEDHFALAGATTPEEIELLFQLYYAYLVDPGFRQESLILALSQYDQEYEALAKAVEGGMALEGERFLAGGDSRFGMPAPNVMKRHTVSDMEGWLGPRIGTADMEISIVGDLDVDRIIDLAAVYLGALPAKTSAPLAHSRGVPVFPKGQSLNVSVPTSLSKAMVDRVWLTGDFRDNRRNRRLSALAQVVSDRMRVQIREDMGAAYSSFAYHDPSRAYDGYGLFHAVAQINPGQVQAVNAAILSIMEDIAGKGVSREELGRAIKPILTTIRERVKTNDYWLDSVLKGSRRRPDQLNWARNFEADYAAITAEELTALARNYFKEGDAATVVITPRAEGAGSETKSGR